MSKVEKNIKALKDEVSSITNEEELISLRKKISLLNEKEYTYQNGFYYLSMLVFGVILAFSFLGYDGTTSSDAQNPYLWVMGLSVIAIILMIVVVVGRKSSENDLEELVFNTHKYIYANLKHSNPSQVEKYRGLFNEFTRGHHSREIYGEVSGLIECDNKKIPYEYYNFKYVRVETKTRIVVTKQGTSVETYQEDVTYYRHGFFLDLDLGHNFNMCEDGFFSNDNFNSSSSKFNDKFDVHTQDQFKTTKFLKPSVIVILTEKMNLGSFTLESVKGKTLITFDDSDMLHTVFSLEKFDLFDVEDLAKLNKENLKMPKLNEYMDLIKRIVNLTDKNFDS